MVKLLLKHGADVNARDDSLTTSLHLAEDHGQLEVAQLLLKHKADVNAQDDMARLRCINCWEASSGTKGRRLSNHVRLLSRAWRGREQTRQAE
jgi:ankyrin repeat protein